MEIRHNSSFGLYSKSERQAVGITQSKTASGLLASSISSVKDEYIPTVMKPTSSSAEKEGISASSIDEAVTKVMKQHGLGEKDLFSVGLVIDKSGKFQSTGGSVKQQSYDWNTPDQGELGAIINDLNNTKVNGVALSEAMLENFAKESGMDLQTERNKDSFYYTCQIINPIHNPNVNQAERGPDSFAKVGISVVTVEGKVYASDIPNNLGIGRYYDENGNLIKITADAGTRACSLTPMDAPWNQDTSIVELGGFEGPDRLSQLKSEKTQKGKQESIFDTDALDVAIREIMKDNGFAMKSGDSIVLELSKTRMFSFDLNSSQIAGADEKTLGEIGKILETNLNATFFKDNPSAFKNAW
ncbi:MAG: hypothetical protein ACRC2T_14165 [Thermoguttaceae bacterium]